ncbi:MAG: metal-dependent hydrolase [Candidatus Dadabacteria bacterium]|nr:metal-dependent hydrolase [Candidatus Dadabacteria bacterium]
MDPVSQGLIGAVLPQSLSNKKEIRLAAAIGLLSGLLADIDVVIRSSTDPLLFLDYHRQFTHSLIFIPIGGLVAAGFCWLFLKKRLSFWKIYLYAFLGYGTHCFLDASTNYGTQLLWPFSDARIAWNVISIIDPIFTFTLVFLVIIAVVRKSPLIARIGLLFAIIYLLFGLYQRERAEDVLIALAQSRGHKVERTLVHPSIGNLLVWRSIYESNGNYYVDAVRVGLFSEPKIYNGGSIKVFDPIQELTGLDPNSVLYGDINRFRRFATDFLVIHPQYPDIIGDLRMGILPNSIKPIWGIKFNPDEENEHVSMDNYERSVNGEKIQTFISMLLGRDIMSNKVQQRK